MGKRGFVARIKHVDGQERAPAETAGSERSMCEGEGVRGAKQKQYSTVTM